MKTATLALLLALGAFTTACGPSISMRTPAGFAVLEKQQEYVYRAASADGVVIGVRAEKNDPAGDLDFWAPALTHKLLGAGYTLESEPKEVRTATGLVGREVRFTRDHGGRAHRFWIAVFVTGARVWVVEAGGDAERFNGKVEAAVRKAIESIGVS